MVTTRQHVHAAIYSWCILRFRKDQKKTCYESLKKESNICLKKKNRAGDRRTQILDGQSTRPTCTPHPQCIHSRSASAGVCCFASLWLLVSTNFHEKLPQIKLVVLFAASLLPPLETAYTHCKLRCCLAFCCFKSKMSSLMLAVSS